MVVEEADSDDSKRSLLIEIEEGRADGEKKPPPKSPQGFNIHEPAPRLRREGGEKEKDRERKRNKMIGGEASAKVNGKEVLKFDTH
ncbi:conserved hypothetical protein [Ricinus communis]|uniref:Uncharacterized protein n=1 Tax=Ricinus communis TaxID=3988 RepID=B9S539_RICCO|nr:conserved hypothetical protein [Ricinus communis]